MCVSFVKIIQQASRCYLSSNLPNKDSNRGRNDSYPRQMFTYLFNGCMVAELFALISWCKNVLGPNPGRGSFVLSLHILPIYSMGGTLKANLNQAVEYVSAYVVLCHASVNFRCDGLTNWLLACTSCLIPTGDKFRKSSILQEWADKDNRTDVWSNWR